MALAAALFCGAGGEPASAAGMAIAYPAAPAPIVTVRGNAVVNSANKPNGTYELALCVQTRVYTHKTSGQTLTPEEYNELTDAEKADYQESNNPFESVSASVVVDLDALTPIQWDVDAPTYAAWDGTSYATNDAGYTPAGAAATGYARGIDTTDLLGTVIPDVTGATLGRPGRVVALDTAKPDEVGTAEALVEGYIHADGKTYAVVSLSANVPHSAKGRTYDTATEVVVVRFAYDMKRFPNTKFTATTPSEFNVTLDENTTGTGPRTVTYLASDADAAQTVTGQGVWYQSNTDPTGATQQETMHYFYRAGNGPIPGTVLNEKVTVSIDGDTQDSRELHKPDTAGKTVLTHDAAATEPYSLTRNLLKTHDRSLRFTYVNQPTYREAKGTGGAMVLFYDWDDTLIGTLVVDPEGDVRAQVNEYVEQNLVHPDLRAGKVLAAMGGEAPDYASLTAPTADQTKYQNLCDSLERQYTYRGKYPYTVGGSVTQDDANALPGEEFPLTNKLDYAFYRRVTTPTEATDPATSATSTYFTTQKVSETGENDENLYPYVYGWAVVEDLSANNARDWQVRRDAAKVSSIWTTVGVGELADVDPQAAARDIPGAAADPGTGLAPQYTFSTSAAAGNDYLHFADFSDMGSMLTKTVTVAGEDVTFTKDTLIVKAVYEPGPELLEGNAYRIIEEPSYNKLNEKGAAAGGAYSVQITLERSSTVSADGLLRGVSRVRSPAIRQDTTIDQKWIEDAALGVDHNLSNPSIATAQSLTETTFTKIDTDNGDEVSFTLVLSARQNKVDYFIIETYGYNFVAGGQRSNTNFNQYGTAHAIDNYNYDAVDSATNDSYYDKQNYYYQVTDYENREGSHGFVLYGTLNYLMEKATLVNRGQMEASAFYQGAGDTVINDANLRLDALGTKANSGNVFDYWPKLLDAAAACEANKSADTWDYTHDCAQLSYHQLQLYILEGALYDRATADNTPITWCHLHKSCADLSSGAPKTWQEIIDAAGGTSAEQDTIEKMAVADVENLTGLRTDANGTKYTNLTTFKNDIVAAVADGCTSWTDIQYHIINKSKPADNSAALENYWWYDSALTAKPTARSLSDLANAAADYYNGVTLKDGVTVTGWTVKLSGLEAAFTGNQTSDGSIGNDWLRLTENLVKGWTVNPDGTETTTPYHAGTTTYQDFLTELLAALKKGIDAGETSAPDFWQKLQYVLLHPTNSWPSSSEAELSRYWWYNGGKFLAVTDVKSMLEVALVADTDGQTAWGSFTYAKFETGAGFADIRDLKWNFDGTGPIDSATFDDFKAQMVSFAKDSGETDFDPATNAQLWAYLQYQLIHPNFDQSGALTEYNGGYYWWKGNATTGQAVSLSKDDLGTAGFGSKVNGNTAAWGNLTDTYINNWRFRKPTDADLDADTYAAHTDMPVLSMADLKGAVEALVDDRLQKQEAADPGGHHHTPPAITWLDIQHYVVTGKLDIYDTTDGGFPDEAAAKERYWWHSGGKNPDAKSVFQTIIEDIAARGKTAIDALTGDQIMDSSVQWRIVPTNGNMNTAAMKQVRIRLNAFYDNAVAEHQDMSKLTWYQIQYTLMAKTQTGGQGLYKNAADAETWWMDNMKPNGKKFADWRPDWLK